MRVVFVSLVLCASACQLDIESEEQPTSQSREALGAPYRLIDVGLSAGSSSNPFAFTPVPNSTRTAFFANTPNEGLEPWVTDGTAAGTVLLADIVPGISPSATFAPNSLFGSRWVPMGGALYTRSTEFTGNTLWRTDGTPSGTQRVFSADHINFGPEAMARAWCFRCRTGSTSLTAPPPAPRIR